MTRTTGIGDPHRLQLEPQTFGVGHAAGRLGLKLLAVGGKLTLAAATRGIRKGKARAGGKA